MKKESSIKLLIIGFFAIAMGFLEAAVVIYLRKIYYPQGFNFPLRGLIEPSVLGIEWAREFFTILMLITVAFLAGKFAYERFAYFIYAFAVWDIFYYVFLKLVLGWPDSFLTRDVLFLIPWPWISPVISPIINSATMILLVFLILHYNDKFKGVKIKTREWFLIILGSLIILYTYMYDYGKLIFSGGFARDFFTLATNYSFINAVSNYIPNNYNWPLFIFGEILVLTGIIIFYLRNSGKR